MGCGCGKTFSGSTPSGMRTTSTPAPGYGGQSTGARVVSSAPMPTLINSVSIKRVTV